MNTQLDTMSMNTQNLKTILSTQLKALRRFISLEESIDQEKNHSALFLLQPLNPGHGITVANAIRRILLSDIGTFAITGVRINKIKHEFDIVEGIREDTLEILLNLKEIIFQASPLAYKAHSTAKIGSHIQQSTKSLTDIIEKKASNSSFKTESERKNRPFKMIGFLNAKGPLIVTAGMFNLPRFLLKILNPTQYICTIVAQTNLYLEIDIEYGTGYTLTEEITTKNTLDCFQPNRPATLLVDAIFMPVQKTNYKIKVITDTRGYIKEALYLEVVTNGSITPERSLNESLKILLNLFSPLFMTENFVEIACSKFTRTVGQTVNLLNSEKKDSPFSDTDVVMSPMKQITPTTEINLIKGTAVTENTVKKRTTRGKKKIQSQ